MYSAYVREITNLISKLYLHTCTYQVSEVKRSNYYPDIIMHILAVTLQVIFTHATVVGEIYVVVFCVILFVVVA